MAVGLGFQAFTAVALVQSLAGELRSCEPPKKGKKKIPQFELENVFEMIEPNILFMYEGKAKEKTCAQDTTNSWHVILLQLLHFKN